MLFEKWYLYELIELLGKINEIARWRKIHSGVLGRQSAIPAVGGYCGYWTIVAAVKDHGTQEKCPTNIPKLQIH